MKKLLHYTVALLFGLTLATTANAAGDEPAEGQIAPDFSITRFDGSEFRLSDFRGKKAVYLVFWNTWCTYCMKKIPKLLDAQQNLKQEIEIIAVNTTLKDSLDKSIAFQKQYAITYPLAFDYGKKVTVLYGVWGTPTEFIIDVNGIIQHRDGVPQNLRAHLADWNRLIEASNLATTDDAAEITDCEKDTQIC